jgi:diguanylate cyclase
MQESNHQLEMSLEASREDISALQRDLEDVRREALLDPLTKIYNRKAFDDGLVKEVSTASTGTGAGLCLMLLDIDHFKGFNDTWGHQTGDQVIRYVASVIGRLGATPRFAARYGGEEFAMIFPAESAAAVAATLEEIRLEVASRMLKRRSTNDDLGTITISSGFAERRKDEMGINVMERADAALYQSKRGGRNQVTNADRRADAA